MARQVAIGFQSIGVTKDWRLIIDSLKAVLELAGFQSIGVTKDWRPPNLTTSSPNLAVRFPINRRHQGLATGTVEPRCLTTAAGFQSIGVTKDWRRLTKTYLSQSIFVGFQSIGVTKDWRLWQCEFEAAADTYSFQSIGVTKDWRRFH